jgi:hypothetical protein
MSKASPRVRCVKLKKITTHIEVEIAIKVLKFLLSSFTYGIILFVKLKSSNNDFTSMAKTTLDVFLALKSAIITWQGIHWSSMKFMINGKMSHLDLDIHISKEVVVVAHFAIANSTYLSIIFVGIANKCSFINCF